MFPLVMMGSEVRKKTGEKKKSCAAQFPAYSGTAICEIMSIMEARIRDLTQERNY